MNNKFKQNLNFNIENLAHFLMGFSIPVEAFCQIWRSRLEKGEPSLHRPQFAQTPFLPTARFVTSQIWQFPQICNLKWKGGNPKQKGTATLIQHSISSTAEIEMVYLSFDRFQSWDFRQREEKDENDECLSETPSALLLFKVWLEGKYYYLLFVNLRERLHRVSFLEIISLEIRPPFLDKSS